MECEEFEEWLSEYADGTLDDISKELLEGHLRFCPHCTEVLGRMRHLTQALHRLGGESPPAAFQLRLDRRLGAARLRTRRRAQRTLRWGIALAAALAWLLWPVPDQRPNRSETEPVAKWSPSSHPLNAVGPAPPPPAVRPVSF